MRDYSKVSAQFWTGKTGRSLRGDMQTQIVALYLMTSPHANMIGVFNCPIVYISHETGSPFEGALNGLKKLVEGGFCTYDDDSETVWIHEMAKFQIGDSLKASDNRVKDIQKQYENLPEGQIKQGFYEKYGGAYHLPLNEPKESPLQAPSKPLASQKQEQKQEQEQKQDVSALQAGAGVMTIPVAAAPEPEKPDTVFQEQCRSVWSAYAGSYADRYGTNPVRNAKVNSNVKAFVQRVGAEEAPQIAAWFVSHPGGFYTGRMHDFGCLLSDAEKLRTEWATGRVMTQGKARQSDRTGTTGAALAEVLAELGDAA